MKESTRIRLIFGASLIIPFIFYRILVFTLYKDQISILRSLTGLSFHHYHYGTILLTIGILLLIFHKRTTLAVVMSGVGLGLVLDTFIPSLLLVTSREAEINAYFGGFEGSIVLYLIVIILAVVLSWKMDKIKLTKIPKN